MLGVAISAVLFMGLVLPTHAQIEKSDLYIGLLLDFGAEATDDDGELPLLQEEIHKVLGVDRSVHFLPEHMRFSAEQADYLSLANDPAVDLIIAAGPASAAMLAAQGALPKPTIAVGILDVELQQMPLVETRRLRSAQFYLRPQYPPNPKGPGGVPPHPSLCPPSRRRQ